MSLFHHDVAAGLTLVVGDPSKSNEQWYGYPTCWTVGDSSVIKDKQFKIGEQMVMAPNSTFNDASCAAQSIPPRLALQAHSAPIDGKFDKDFANMFVSFVSIHPPTDPPTSTPLTVPFQHGSWNRQPATGYKVVQIPFTRLNNSRYDPVAAPDTAIGKGYSDILWTQGESSCSSSTCLRPTGIVWHPDSSRMYVGSDGSVGELYILYKDGQAASL